jgi:3-dehydroquinate dehydratase
LLDTEPSPELNVGVLQASVEVAVPNALLMSAPDGLHPSEVEVPPVVIDGAVTSTIQVTVRDAVAVLPQPSIAVHLLV